MPEAKTDTLWNEQAFLLDFYNVWVPNQFDYKYENFHQIQGDPSALVNKLFQGKSTTEFLNLTTVQVAALVPTLRVFKIIYPDKKRKGLYTDYGTPVETEFYFNDFTDVDSITESLLGRGTDVGLKGFTWKDTGTNIADTGLSFQCELQLYFQSMEALFKNRPATDQNGRSIDHGIQFSDLLMPRKSALWDKNDDRLEQQDQDFQIRILAGWAVPDDGAELFKPEEITAIQRTITPFLLTLVDHDIDIREDSSVSLTLNYMAAIEGRMLHTDANLFWVEEGSIAPAFGAMKPGQTRDKVDLYGRNVRIQKRIIRETSRKLDSLKKQISKFESRSPEDYMEKYDYWKLYERAYGETPGWHGSRILWTTGRQRVNSTGLTQQLEDEKVQLEKLQKKEEQAVYESRTKSYCRLLKEISIKSRIFWVKVTDYNIEDWVDSLDRYDNFENTEERNKKIKHRRITSKEAIIQDLASRKALGLKTTGSKALLLANNKLATMKAKDREKFLKDNFETEDKSDNSRGEKYVHFFFFGDLVEAALATVGANQKNSPKNTPFKLLSGENFKFLLGPCELPEYVNDGGKNTFQISAIPMANIPISLSLFQAWWVQNVVKPLKQNYPIAQFLRDVAAELIRGALSPLTYGPVGTVTKSRLSYQTFAIPQKKDGNHLTKYNVSAKDVSDLTAQDWLNFRDVNDLKQYLLMFMGGSFSDKLCGEDKKDALIGVFHFYIGAEKGLVKKVAFSKTDIAGYREAKIEKSQRMAKKNLLFSNRYKATLTMIGNTIFKNGDLLFISPSSLGIPDVTYSIKPEKERTIAEEMGLGGYYTVIGINSTIEDGKFETVLNLEHTGVKCGGTEIKIPSPIGDQRFVVTATKGGVDINKLKPVGTDGSVDDDIGGAAWGGA